MAGSDHYEQGEADRVRAWERSPDREGRGIKRTRGLLAGMRIRKKLMFLHTVFSVVLAGILLVAMRPAIGEIVRQAEAAEARVTLRSLLSADGPGVGDSRVVASEPGTHAELRTATAEALGLTPDQAQRVRRATSAPITVRMPSGRVAAVASHPSGEDGATYSMLTVRNPEARAAVWKLYALLIIALLSVYGLVALALEVFVLPQHVYAPIRRMLQAEQALQDGRAEDELIPEHAIPADELGEIMRSRNGSIAKLRAQERALAEAFERIEQVATDLRKKNHLLERARQNLADADRLASLGMMSAGLAHELNTPLSVLKGIAERIERDPSAGVSPEQASLMVRVVRRLERLGEGLLDFARVRPTSRGPVELRGVVDEAITLVGLDRDVGPIELSNRVPPGVEALCDADRIVQVMVNLIRNAVDAIRDRVDGRGAGLGLVQIDAERIERDGSAWVSLTVSDDGPGIPPEVLPSIFEPFVSTRLDARGTGLGLAVAEGIIREHGGVMLARNRADQRGAVFEALLPGVAGDGSGDGEAACRVGPERRDTDPDGAKR